MSALRPNEWNGSDCVASSSSEERLSEIQLRDVRQISGGNECSALLLPLPSEPREGAYVLGALEGRPEIQQALQPNKDRRQQASKKPKRLKAEPHSDAADLSSVTAVNSHSSRTAPQLTNVPKEDKPHSPARSSPHETHSVVNSSDKAESVDWKPPFSERESQACPLSSKLCTGVTLAAAITETRADSIEVLELAIVTRCPPSGPSVDPRPFQVSISCDPAESRVCQETVGTVRAAAWTLSCSVIPFHPLPVPSPNVMLEPRGDCFGSASAFVGNEDVVPFRLDSEVDSVTVAQLPSRGAQPKLFLSKYPHS